MHSHFADIFEGDVIATVRVPALPSRLKLLRGVVKLAAEACGCSPDCTRDIVIAVGEACQNVIRHGYGDTDTIGTAAGSNSYEGANVLTSRELVLDVRLFQQRVEVNIIDFAPPVDTARVVSRSLDDIRPGGLGVHFIRECMDDMAFKPPPDGCGNRLWMAKRIS